MDQILPTVNPVIENLGDNLKMGIKLQGKNDILIVIVEFVVGKVLTNQLRFRRCNFVYFSP